MLNITQRIKELNKWRDTVLSWIRSQDADSPLIDAKTKHKSATIKTLTYTSHHYKN